MTTESSRNHTNMSKLMKTVVISIAAATLAACSAAPTQCLVARPGVGGYGVYLTRNGGAPAGCDDAPASAFSGGVYTGTPSNGKASPAAWFDGWRTDLYKTANDAAAKDNIAFSSNYIGLLDPASVVQAPWPDAPDAQNYCKVTDVPALTGATVDPLGLGGTETALSYKINSITFLDGALYAGLQFTADVTATFGTCTANYTAIGVAPSLFEGFLNGNAAACRTDDDCAANADPAAGRSLGSGYNPTFKIVCRQDIGLSFIYGPPPYCLKTNKDGSCATPDPDTRQKGGCYVPATGSFPFLN